MYAKQGQKISAFIDKIKIIPLTEEKYISFTIEDLKFVDSLSFLPSSLEKLVENLKNGDKNDLSAFHVTKHFMKLEYPDITDEQMLLLCQKGVVPYEYMNSFDKYNETQLPPIEAFRNKLNDEECNPKDYQHALKVWNTFKIKNLHDYWKLYLTTDVTLLADVFEAFRNKWMESFSLDPAYYITLPSLGNDTALMTYGKSVQLMNKYQSHIYFEIENNIKGGNSCIMTRYAKANNPYINGYDPKKPTTYIIYFDKNSYIQL